MTSLFMLAIFIILFITQVTMLVKYIKKKNNKYIISTYCIDIFSIIIIKYLIYYYEYLAPRWEIAPGLTYFEEEFICFCASIVYFVMFFITIVTNIIVIKNKRKKQI